MQAAGEQSTGLTYLVSVTVARRQHRLLLLLVSVTSIRYRLASFAILNTAAKYFFYENSDVWRGWPLEHAATSRSGAQKLASLSRVMQRPKWAAWRPNKELLKENSIIQMNVYTKNKKLN